MKRKQLAQILVETNSAPERTRLLSANKELADERLARRIKDICYAKWTSTPATARKTANALKSLYKYKPQKEIEALLLWVSGIAEITRGKLDPAITNLDEAAGIFFELKQAHEAAQTSVAKL